MSSNLVIVESPAKAKTIEKYLGKDFKVTSCYGHIRDLAKDDKSIDKENGFIPTYIPSPDKKKVIKELQTLKKKSSKVYIATDNDREGEAIAWHLKEILNLNEEEYERIVFREITKKAVLSSIENPTKINMDLVNAQQARRVLDRLVGFEISPILWKKIKRGLSAGRVQSVAVKFVVDRENEISIFKPESSFKTTAIFSLNSEKFTAELNTRFNNQEESERFLNECKNTSFKVKNIEKKPSKRSPSAPFTTSTLQQEASRKIGFSPSLTMSTAQRLYEAGHITYMRTDSVNLSDEALENSKNVIESSYGNDYFKRRVFKTKSNSAQEAHEAIRPTNFSLDNAGKTDTEKKLYNLIWRRTLASQMSESIFERTVVNINNGNKFEFKASGEIMVFDGFLKLYNDNSENTKLLPKLQKDSILNTEEILCKQVFTKHPPRYSEASLIKKMEDSGIGRPSTFAETIRKIKEREYVVKEERDGKIIKSNEIRLISNEISYEIKEEKTGFEKNKIYPTNMGMFVTEFLNENFNSSFMDYSFTAKTESQLDQIAYKGRNWNSMIEEFYVVFSKLFDNVPEERYQLEKELGEFQGKKLIARVAKFGPVIQIGEKEDADEGFPKYFNMSSEQLIRHISINEALDIINKKEENNSLPTFEYDKGNIELKNGRYGFYLRFNDKNYKIDKEKYPEPKNLSADQAIEIVNTPIEKSKDILKEFDNGLQIRLGKYGKPPYFLAVRGTEIGNIFKEKRKKPFVGIPKEILEKYKNDIQSISDQEVEEIVDKFLNK
ncbi:MAG: type I DNA topoisomerase [Bacteroidota bacterium]|nr:type I DNA topoisomerase [Bacteroidota bacterium]